MHPYTLFTMSKRSQIRKTESKGSCLVMSHQKLELKHNTLKTQILKDTTTCIHKIATKLKMDPKTIRTAVYDNLNTKAPPHEGQGAGKVQKSTRVISLLTRKSW